MRLLDQEILRKLSDRFRKISKPECECCTMCLDLTVDILLFPVTYHAPLSILHFKMRLQNQCLEINAVEVHGLDIYEFLIIIVVNRTLKIRKVQNVDRTFFIAVLFPFLAK